MLYLTIKTPPAILIAPPMVCQAKHVFALINKRMDISDGENETLADFLTPIALPEVTRGSPDEDAPHGNKIAVGNHDGHNAGETAPAVQMPSDGVHTPEGMLHHPPTKNPVWMLVRDPT